MNKQAPPSTELLSEQRQHIGIITFNRPARHNALSPAMLLELYRVLRRWAEAGEVRTVVLTGAGDRAFSAGYDIGAIETVGPEHAADSDGEGRSQTPFEQGLAAVKNFPYPTIAMINGHCFGGALHLAMNCDLRIAADHVAMGMPPAKLGVVYGAQGLREFIQVLGSARARELFFTGRTYRGQALIEMGLVPRLLPAAELSEAVFTLAGEIAANAPLALRGIKRIMNLVENPEFSPQLEDEAEQLVAEAFRSADLKEGQAAFLEKRQAVFTGC